MQIVHALVVFSRRFLPVGPASREACTGARLILFMSIARLQLLRLRTNRTVRPWRDSPGLLLWLDDLDHGASSVHGVR